MNTRGMVDCFRQDRPFVSAGTAPTGISYFGMVIASIPSHTTLTFPPRGISGPVASIAVQHGPLALSQESFIGNFSPSRTFWAEHLKTTGSAGSLSLSGDKRLIVVDGRHQMLMIPPGWDFAKSKLHGGNLELPCRNDLENSLGHPHSKT